VISGPPGALASTLTQSHCYLPGPIESRHPLRKAGSFRDRQDGKLVHCTNSIDVYSFLTHQTNRDLALLQILGSDPHFRSLTTNPRPPIFLLDDLIDNRSEGNRAPKMTDHNRRMGWAKKSSGGPFHKFRKIENEAACDQIFRTSWTTKVCEGLGCPISET